MTNPYEAPAEASQPQKASRERSPISCIVILLASTWLFAMLALYLMANIKDLP